MAVTSISLEVNQHDDKTFKFVLTDQDGVPVNYVDCSDIVFSLAPNISSASIFTKTKLNGDFVNPVDNKFEMRLTAEETGALAAGTLYCEVKVYVGAYEFTVGGGPFAVTDTQIGDYN